MDNEKELKAFYFPHDIGASHDPKLINLRMRFGWKAIGMFWAIIEALHKEENGELPDFMIKSLIYDYYGQEEIRTLSHTKEEAEEFEASLYANALLVRNNGIATSKRVKENLLSRKTKSEKARASAEKRWHKTSDTNNVVINANAVPPQCERNAIKERKEKEIKHIPKTKFLDFVLLTDFEYKRLIEELGSEIVVREYTQRLNDYIGSKGIKYKSHYHTILNWWRKEGKQAQGGVKYL